MSNLERKMGKASLAAIAGIGAAGAGSGIVENQRKYNEDKKEQDKKRLQEKMEKDEPTGGGSESKATPLNYKKGGNVKHSDMSKDKPMMKAEAEKAVKGHEKRMHKMAKGGVTRADGCVSKGHTKGKMVKMAGGGAC
jgi:hypothetical protein